MALTSKVYVDEAQRNIGNGFRGVIKSFRATANVNYKKGDFVTIDDDGRVLIDSTGDIALDGIIFSNVDNTGGADDALSVPVLLKGNVWADTFFSSTAANGNTIKIGTECTTNSDGQVLNPTSATNKQFVSLSKHEKPNSGTEIRKGLFFFKGSGKFV